MDNITRADKNDTWAVCTDSPPVFDKDDNVIRRADRASVSDIDDDARMKCDVITEKDATQMNELYFIPSQSYANKHVDSKEEKVVGTTERSILRKRQTVMDGCSVNERNELSGGLVRIQKEKGHV